MNTHNGTVVLVHGAWADGSCWQNVILPLERLGLKVICAPLPLTSLTDDIAALSRTLERVDGPLVLVGHAYAGAVIAGPADDRIKALVSSRRWLPERVKRLRRSSIANRRIQRLRIWRLTHTVSFGCQQTVFVRQSLTKRQPIRLRSWLRCNDRFR